MKTPAIYHVASFHAFVRAFRASALKCAGVFRKKAKLYEGSLDDALVSAANKRKTPKGGKDRALGDLAARGALQQCSRDATSPSPTRPFCRDLCTRNYYSISNSLLGLIVILVVPAPDTKNLGAITAVEKNAKKQKKRDGKMVFAGDKKKGATGRRGFDLEMATLNNSSRRKRGN